MAALAMLLIAGHSAMAAENGWTIQTSTSGSVTTFTISRTNTAVAETVRYRFVNLSAYAGQHYNVTATNGSSIPVAQQSAALTGEFTFAAGDATSRTIQVTESAGSGAYSYYKDNTQRSYKLELTDAGGFYLTSNTRSFTTGTSINSTNAFGAKEVDVNTGTITVTDKNYSQAYHAVPVATYFNSAAPKNYLVAAGAELRMTLSFQAKEKDDGYQHVQILVNQTSNHDEGSGDNNPGTMNYSSYMATFCHKGGSTNTTYSNYVFPDVNHNSNCGNVGLVWSSINSTNDVGELRQQYFNTDCRADDGRLIIAGKSALNSFSTLGIRFDASGNNEDTWYAYNVKAKIQAVDVTVPAVLAVSVAPGYHAKGNTVYVSVAFSEIVTTSSAKLTSNWGDLAYVAGSGTNVLTFSRTIPASASDAFNITGFSGITDLAGKAPSSVSHSNLCSLDASYAYTITYDLDGGTLATQNPTTYTYETAVTINNQPILAAGGYVFAGWTGSNGNTPQTSVTIPAGSHGNKSYTANWTPLWGQDSGATGEDEAHPYIISSTAGLDMLAKVVNGTDGYNANDFYGKFFKLANDITYTHTTDWNDASSTENNYTAIGRQSGNTYYFFKGTFDGDNHTISGIRIYKGGNNNADSCQGLFGCVGASGTVKNVTLSDTRIAGYIAVGTISGLNNGNVINCHAAATVVISAVSIYPANYHGGIVGQNGKGGTILNCTSAARLTSNFQSTWYYGAIAGQNAGTGSVINCLAVGASIPSMEKNYGVIVGYNNGGTLTNNYYRNCTVGDTANATNVGVGNSTNAPADQDGARSIHTLVLTLPPQNVGISVSGESVVIDHATYYASNTTVTVSGDYTGYYFSGCTVKDAGDNAIYGACDGYVYTFTMPASDVTVKANLEVIPWTGAGTEADPYIILYPSQMKRLAGLVNDGTRYENKFFKLGADIAYDPNTLDAKGENYTAIGNDIRYFSGTFDGDGHTISGIRINNNFDYQGLFGCVSGDGTIQNVILVNSTITGQNYVGGIAGCLSERGSVQNCRVEGDVTIGTAANTATGHGGIAGYNSSGTISGCFSAATVTSSGKRSGGIVGSNNDQVLVLNNITVGSTVIAADGNGAIVGKSSGNLANNYYYNCTIGSATSNVGGPDGDVSASDGAVRAVTSTTKPAEIGAQIATYPHGGLTVYEHGAYYNGTYYLRHDLAGTATALSLVKGTKDGITAWWGTFYDSTASYTLSEGAAAYTMGADYHLFRLGTDGRTIPAGTAVVIIATSGSVSIVPGGSSSAADNAPGGNILVGRDVATVIDGICVLSVNAPGAVGFYPLSGIALPAHKAGYLPQASMQNYDKQANQEW